MKFNHRDWPTVGPDAGSGGRAVIEMGKHRLVHHSLGFLQLAEVEGMDRTGEGVYRVGGVRA